jgi:hypothetical protein
MEALGFDVCIDRHDPPFAQRLQGRCRLPPMRSTYAFDPAAAMTASKQRDSLNAHLLWVES